MCATLWQQAHSTESGYDVPVRCTEDSSFAKPSDFLLFQFHICHRLDRNYVYLVMTCRLQPRLRREDGKESVLPGSVLGNREGF